MITTNGVTRTVNGPGVLRSLVEIGVELSFKAFKTWDSDGTPMRHVIEPYADYTFIPDPTMTNQLYQFDSVDTLGGEHQITLGVRNKLQTKNEEKAFDLVDLDTYTILNIERTEGESFFNYVYLDAIITPIEEFKTRIDATYDVQQSELDTLDVHRHSTDPTHSAQASNRITRKKNSNLFSENTTFYLSRKWYLNVYGRYEFEDSTLEEVGGYLQRNYDCISVRTGVGFRPGYTNTDGTQVKDDWRVNVEFWLTAFPGSGFSSRHRD